MSTVREPVWGAGTGYFGPERPDVVRSDGRTIVVQLKRLESLDLVNLEHKHEVTVRCCGWMRFVKGTPSAAGCHPTWTKTRSTWAVLCLEECCFGDARCKRKASPAI